MSDLIESVRWDARGGNFVDGFNQILTLPVSMEVKSVSTHFALWGALGQPPVCAKEGVCCGENEQDCKPSIKVISELDGILTELTFFGVSLKTGLRIKSKVDAGFKKVTFREKAAIRTSYGIFYAPIPSFD